MDEQKEAVPEGVSNRKPPIKLYDVTINSDGSVRVVSDLTPDDMKMMLELAFVMLLTHGLTAPSLASFFPSKEEQQAAFLDNITEDKMFKA